MAIQFRHNFKTSVAQHNRKWEGCVKISVVTSRLTSLREDRQLGGSNYQAEQSLGSVKDHLGSIGGVKVGQQNEA